MFVELVYEKMHLAFGKLGVKWQWVSKAVCPLSNWRDDEGFEERTLWG